MRRWHELFGLALVSLGCGRHELDLLVPTGSEDPCLALQTESACDANAALGCSFQPNARGCQSGSPSCQPGTCRSGDPFVRRVETSFLLNGEAFRFVGVSSWGILQPDRCASVLPEAREAWLQRAFDDLVAAQPTVGRFFAFQNSAGPSGTDFSLFDHAVRAARRAGMRLIFVLEHAEGGCSRGERRDSDWYGGGYLTPDADYVLSYREYAETVARRYRDEPAVLGYVLMQGLGGGDTDALSSFISDVGQLLHGVAPNQLVSLDLSWGLTSADGGAAFRQLQQLPVVDYVDLDDYVDSDSPIPLAPAKLDAIRDIGKPAVIGEGAFRLDGGDEAALVRRAGRASKRMLEWREGGFVGGLLWAYMPGWSEVSEEFDARSADPLLQSGGALDKAPF